MNTPIILTGIRATAAAAAFGTGISPVANVDTAPKPAPAPASDTVFKVGKVYACRSVCDHDCIFRFIVVARTAKSVKLRGVGGPRNEPCGKVITRRIKVWSGVETVMPHGNYSMAAVLSADRGDI